MFHCDEFKLTRQAALALLISSAFSGTAAAAVATVDFAIGPVTATGPDGKERALAKGATIDVGDTVNTAEGRAQLRFTDGAYASLQSQTNFRVDDYAFVGQADGKEKGFFSLLKGGFRTITGAIGKLNKQNYRVTTPTATIGIRGTEYLAQEKASLLVSVPTTSDNAVVVTNLINPVPVVCLPGQTVFVKAPDTPAVPTAQQISLPPSEQTQGGTPPEPQTFTSGGQVSPTGAAAIVTQVNAPFVALAPGPGYAMAYSIGGELSNLCQIGCVSSSSQCGQPIVTLFSNGIEFTQGSFYGMTAPFADPLFGGPFIDPGLNSVNPLQFTATFKGGVVGGGTLLWGYFTNGTLGDPNDFPIILGPNQGFHVILGIPTPAMPTMGSATYTMIPGGFTTPTYSDNIGGNLGTNGIVTSGSFTASFTASPAPNGGLVSGSMGFAFPGGNYSMNFLSPGLSISGSGFTGSGFFSKSSGTSTICTGSCSSIILGFFAGANTSTPVFGPPFAGLVYEVPTGGFAINGAAAFQK